MTESLVLRSAFVCDDVRREETGKLILIGVYGGDIRVTKWPLNLGLTLVVELIAEAPIETAINFRCMSGEAVISEIKGRMDANEPGRSIIPIPGFAIRDMRSETTLHFQWQYGDEKEEWETICSLPVTFHGDATAASAS